MRSALWGGSSTDAAPMTGSLVSFTPLDCLNDYCAAECASGWLFCGTDCVCFAHCEIFIWGVGLYWTKTMEGAALVCAGITFGVKLYVPWDAPEAVVDIRSEGVYSGCSWTSRPSSGRDGKPFSAREGCSQYLFSGPELPRRDDCGHG